MGLSFLSLLYLQVSYIEEMVTMRREQFDESVQRSLDQVCRNMELNETRNYLEADAVAVEKAAREAEEAAAAMDNGHVSDDEVVKYTQRYSISSRGGLGNFEWEMNDGRSGWSTECCSFTTVDDIRNNKFKMPKDKPLKKKATAMPVAPVQTFEEIQDEDLPF